MESWAEMDRRTMACSAATAQSRAIQSQSDHSGSCRYPETDRCHFEDPFMGARSNPRAPAYGRREERAQRQGEVFKLKGRTGQMASPTSQ